MLLDGTEFFDTSKDKEPATFAVNDVIKGWAEVLPLGESRLQMGDLRSRRTGLRRKGCRSKIGPNQTLIFEIELLGIDS